jgi:hypothetical protein
MAAASEALATLEAASCEGLYRALQRELADIGDELRRMREVREQANKAEAAARDARARTLPVPRTPLVRLSQFETMSSRELQQVVDDLRRSAAEADEVYDNVVSRVACEEALEAAELIELEAELAAMQRHAPPRSLMSTSSPPMASREEPSPLLYAADSPARSRLAAILQAQELALSSGPERRRVDRDEREGQQLQERQMLHSQLRAALDHQMDLHQLLAQRRVLFDIDEQ